MEFEPTNTEKFQNDRFLIEDGIVKGIELPIASRFGSLGEMIWRNLSDSPEHVAQIDAATGKKKTFKDVKERSISLSLWMRKKGIRPGDIITVCSPDHLDVDVIIFSTLFVGAIHNTFPWKIDSMLARRFIKHIEPRVIFVCKDNLVTLQKAAEMENHECEMIVLDNEDDGEKSFTNILHAQSSDDIENFQITKDVNRESLCLISPTSGSTGIPKFVSYSHGKVLQRFPQKYFDTVASNETPRTLLHLFPEWEVYFTYVLLLLLSKSTKIFVRDFQPLESARIIEKYTVNHFVLSPYKVLLFGHTDGISNYNLDSVTTITSMGGVLAKKALKKINTFFPNAHVHKILGSSETIGITKYTEKSRNPESEGTVLPNVQLKVIDVVTGKTLGANEVGEICVKSPFTMTGYYKNPVATALLYDDEGWFHMGDEAYYDDNGEIVIVGRLKDKIRSRDCDLQPSYFEKILMSHPDIIEAAVIAISDELLVEKPVACIRKLHGSKITKQDVQKLMNEHQYGHLFENSIVFLDEIPRTTNGKINKLKLKEHVEKLSFV